jgi:hypothetical protein
VREFDQEPIPGLPEHLPTGERILWQGRPEWTSLARRAFHVGGVAIYFLALAAALAWLEISDGRTASDAAHAAAGVVPGAIIALVLLGGLAALSARAAMYTITSRRVVMRFGVALPVVINIPFKQIKSADLKLRADGSGDVALTVSGSKRQSIVVLWPHVRPWRTVEPEPMLRCIPDAHGVAEILSTALRIEFPNAPAVPLPARGAAPVSTSEPIGPPQAIA